MNNNKRLFEEDDSRVICNMDVEGMSSHTGLPFIKETHSPAVSPHTEPLTRSEARRFTAHALLAVLLIGTVFAITWILFTLFLTKVLFS